MEQRKTLCQYRDMCPKSKDAFTLVEMLVGIAMLAILAGAVAYPSLKSFGAARAKSAEAYAAMIEAAKMAYLDENPFFKNTEVLGDVLTVYFPAKKMPPAPKGYIYKEGTTVIGTTSQELHAHSFNLAAPVECVPQ